MLFRPADEAPAQNPVMRHQALMPSAFDDDQLHLRDAARDFATVFQGDEIDFIPVNEQSRDVDPLPLEAVYGVGVGNIVSDSGAAFRDRVVLEEGAHQSRVSASRIISGNPTWMASGVTSHATQHKTEAAAILTGMGNLPGGIDLIVYLNDG